MIMLSVFPSKFLKSPPNIRGDLAIDQRVICTISQKKNKNFIIVEMHESICQPKEIIEKNVCGTSFSLTMLYHIQK
jgi:hypothetical protein